jgi:hypothetical protein
MITKAQKRSPADYSNPLFESGIFQLFSQLCWPWTPSVCSTSQHIMEGHLQNAAEPEASLHWELRKTHHQLQSTDDAVQLCIHITFTS